MGNSAPKTPAALIVVFFIFFTVNPSLTFSPSFSHYNALLSLSHSLITRVANLRTSRGDFEGAARARAIAQKLEAFRGRGFWKLAWTLGCDYLRNFAWSDINRTSFSTLASAISDVNELLRFLNELSGLNSGAERVSWVNRNYKNVLNVARPLLDKILAVFRESAALRDVLEILQTELVEGNLLRDCLEVGTDDFKGLVQVLKDIALDYAATSSRRAEL